MIWNITGKRKERDEGAYEIPSNLKSPAEGWLAVVKGKIIAEEDEELQW